jgi:hypothetical protein
VVSWDDILHEGPVRAVAPGRFRAERATYIASRGWALRAVALAGLEARDAALQSALDAGEEIALWFEDDLYDALQLIQAVQRIDRHIGRATWTLVPLGGLPFRGIPERSTEELAEAYAARAMPNGAGAYAGRVWEAFTAGDVLGLDALARAPAPLEAVPAALRRLLEELPEVSDRLGRTERVLLEATAAGPVTGIEAFLECAKREKRPFLGDTVAFDRLDGLVASGLVETAGDGHASERTFTASDRGRRVLAGEERAVPTRRWLGGREVGDPDGPHWSRATERVVLPRG